MHGVDGWSSGGQPCVHRGSLTARGAWRGRQAADMQSGCLAWVDKRQTCSQRVWLGRSLHGGTGRDLRFGSGGCGWPKPGMRARSGLGWAAGPALGQVVPIRAVRSGPPPTLDRTVCNLVVLANRCARLAAVDALEDAAVGAPEDR